MKFGGSGDSRVRGPGDVPVYRHGPFFSAKSKKMGSESAQALKIYYVPTLLVLGAETEWPGPHFPRFFRFGKGSPGIFFLPETSHRELSACSPTAERGGFRGPCFREMRGSGNREIGQEETDGGRRGKKTTEKRGKRKDDGRRKTKMGEAENRYI